MSWKLLDFQCKYLEGESNSHIFCENATFCCFIAHLSWTKNPISDRLWKNFSSASHRRNFKRDEQGYLICAKPCKFCIMTFTLKRIVKNIIERYKRVKKYRDHLLQLKNLQKREMNGRY